MAYEFHWNAAVVTETEIINKGKRFVNEMLLTLCEQEVRLFFTIAI